MGILQGKKFLIVGAANKFSIAYGVAAAMHREGAELAFTYQGDKLKERVENIAKEFNSNIAIQCDVAKDDEIANVFSELKKHWDGLDGIVHSVAFTFSSELEGNFVEVVTREGFRVAHDISSYSFTALAKAGLDMMKGRNASLITMSYQGAERVVPNYNVMGLAKASLESNVRYMAASLGQYGIRVNAISAGPIKTLASSAVNNFRRLLKIHEANTPLQRNATAEEVGNTSVFLASDWASGITAEVLHVDSGFHAMTVNPYLEGEGDKA